MSDIKVGDWVLSPDCFGDKPCQVVEVSSGFVWVSVTGKVSPEYSGEGSYCDLVSEVTKLDVKSLADLDLKIGDKVTLLKEIDLGGYEWPEGYSDFVDCDSVCGISEEYWSEVLGVWEVERAQEEEPTPKKMHPDDFYQAVTDLAENNGFKVNNLSFYTQDNLYIQSGI